MSDRFFQLDGPALPKLALAMHARYGATPGKRCRTCDRLMRHEHKHNYYKCTLYGTSDSAATDWRLSYPACGAWWKR